MKKGILFTLILLTSGLVFAQEQSDKAQVTGPSFTFEEDSYDFGDIYQGDVVDHVFVFENTGTEPLIITNVKVTCGCTATNWTRDPILPGEQSSIKVKFDSAGKIGRQNKVILIVSNATNPLPQVKIVTNVLPKKKDSE
ncbi:MAG: DUF1573 domain-containing protein [Bacteroidetes bacterium]|nr:DUF1573 domain-containing protein [Bacteroidota bacterium]